MKSNGSPIINKFSGEPFHVALARPSGSFEFTYAEIGLGTTSVTGDMEMAFEDSSRIHGRITVFTTSIRTAWSAKDRDSRTGSTNEMMSCETPA
jgi:hypothetical protein